MSVTVQFLGTGTSLGVPQIGCGCQACSSTDPKDHRMRTCLWVHDENNSVIIDTPADFRTQCLKYKVDKVDAVCLSHMHSDHFLGLDDVRVFNRLQNSAIDLFINPTDYDAITDFYSYAIGKTYTEVIRPNFIPHEANGKIIDYPGFSIEAFPVHHGSYEIRGFLIKTPKTSMAFITDCKTLPNEVMEQLQDIDLLAIAALWRDFREHSSHMTLDEAITMSERLKAKETWLFHISHLMGLRTDTEKLLPKKVNLTYDGLKLELK